MPRSNTSTVLVGAGFLAMVFVVYRALSLRIKAVDLKVSDAQKSLLTLSNVMESSVSFQRGVDDRVKAAESQVVVLSDAVKQFSSADRSVAIQHSQPPPQAPPPPIAAPHFEGGKKECKCPLCEHTEHTYYASENGHDLAKCSSCGVVYLCPMPDPQTITEATRTGNHKTFREEEWHEFKVGSFKRRIHEFFSEDQSPSSWLDVGAGNGELVKAVQELFPDCDVLGTEPSVTKVARAAKRGLSLRNVSLSALTDKYEVITLMNIISHLPDPIPFYQQICDLLVPDVGCIFMSTGNIGDLPKPTTTQYYYLPDHLLFVGKDNLVSLFQSVGLNAIEVHVHTYFMLKEERKPTQKGFRALYVKACYGDPSVTVQELD